MGVLDNAPNLCDVLRRRSQLPGDGAYQLFPQDWFNSAGLDYGYQWVTRVARDPRTGRIHGEGVRISPFVLDESLRKTL